MVGLSVSLAKMGNRAVRTQLLSMNTTGLSLSMTEMGNRALSSVSWNMAVLSRVIGKDGKLGAGLFVVDRGGSCQYLWQGWQKLGGSAVMESTKVIYGAVST